MEAFFHPSPARARRATLQYLYYNVIIQKVAKAERRPLVIEKIDSVIIAACTKFSHWLQQLTGITSYFLANVGNGLFAISLMLRVVNYFHQIFRLPTDTFDAFLSSFLLLNTLSQSFLCIKAQEHLLGNAETKPAALRSYQKKGISQLRIFWIILLAITLLSAPTAVGGPLWILDGMRYVFLPLGAVIFYCFIAVDPLPPGKSKVRQWVEKLAGAGRLVPAPAEY